MAENKFVKANEEIAEAVVSGIPHLVLHKSIILCGKGIEAAGVHILDAVPIRKIRKILLKLFPRIYEARRGGQARPRADNDGACPLQDLPHNPHRIPEGESDRGRRIVWMDADNRVSINRLAKYGGHGPAVIQIE